LEPQPLRTGDHYEGQQGVSAMNVMATEHPRAKIGKLARISCVIAFVWSGIVAMSALVGPIIILPFALIPLMAGIGILRKRAWGAWGLALYLFAQLLVAPLVLFRSGNSERLAHDVFPTAAVLVVLIPIFVLAGRSLAIPGAERGRAWTWIAVSVLTAAPLIFIQTFVIPTGAMENTLLIGDRILAQRLPKPSPTRGDLIIFMYPIDRHQTFVKRVIGVPGDRIRISKKVVYQNGAALVEPYVIHKNDYPDFYRDNFPSEPEANRMLLDAAREMLKNNVANGEVVVPAGKYFVLGDNRENSFDSRYWGFIGSSDVIGKPLLIYDSMDQTTEDISQQKQAVPKRRRWERLFRFL
jgi:signal peptidase I